MKSCAEAPTLPSPAAGSGIGGKGMDIKTYENFHLEEIINLYQSVGWTNYLERIGILEEAYANSLFVLGAYDSDRLVGIIRAVGDGQKSCLCRISSFCRSTREKGSGQSC